uniref:Uncharacterized protein n=1 Tax=Anguilla anguilla TaxID=7936 RepID=A0A0E9TUZ1_ANGAN
MVTTYLLIEIAMYLWVV